jgi:tRNA(Ile)-lysidine synthetase-like protein
MLRLLQPGRGGRGIYLPRGWRLRAVGGLLEVARKNPSRPEVELDTKECAGCPSRGAVHLKPGEPVRVGHRRPGLRMRPTRGGGTRKLQDLFVDARVPREERDQWPLVFAGDRLAWVPGVAVDADEAAAPGQPGRHVSLRFRSSGRLEERVVESIDRHLGVPN